MLLGRVSRMGFGAMQLPGPRVFGPPRDRDEAIAVLRRAVELGVDHIDTAQYYGPDVANELIHEALHPYPDDLVLVSKLGAGRDEKGAWFEAGSPDELRAGVIENLRSLELDTIPVVNLRVFAGEPDAKFDDQLATMIAMRDEGLIGAIGISNVSLAQFERAVAATDVVCVQNAYSVANRSGADILDACRQRGIAFVPFFPLGSGFGADNPVLGSEAVRTTAERLGATRAQVALAWLLDHADNILLIPGTSSLAHLEENMAAADVRLDDEARAVLDAVVG
jgi:pyridoxine 4-dehydrogenase